MLQCHPLIVALPGTAVRRGPHSVAALGGAPVRPAPATRPVRSGLHRIAALAGPQGRRGPYTLPALTVGPGVAGPPVRRGPHDAAALAGRRGPRGPQFAVCSPRWTPGPTSAAPRCGPGRTAWPARAARRSRVQACSSPAGICMPFDAVEGPAQARKPLTGRAKPRCGAIKVRKTQWDNFGRVTRLPAGQ